MTHGMPINNSFLSLMRKLHLSDQPIWTVSTLEKEPIDAKQALLYRFDPKQVNNWFKLCSDPDTQLVTLEELYQCPNTPLNQIAMHADVLKTHLLMLDIEKKFDPKAIKYLRHLPILYSEISRHGGHHMLIHVPSDVISQDDYQKLWMKTVVKCFAYNEKHTGIEVIMNRHYLTFTQNIDHPNIKPTNNGLTDFLDQIRHVRLIGPSAVNENAFDQVGITDYLDAQKRASQAPTSAVVLAKHVFTPDQALTFPNYVHRVYYENLKDDNTTPDWSRGDYRIISTLFYNYIKARTQGFYKNPYTMQPGMDVNDPYDPNIIAWVIYILALQYLEPRPEKWNQLYYGGKLNYIQYTIRRVITKRLNPSNDKLFRINPNPTQSDS